MKLFSFYESNLFREEFRKAVEAWKATNPLQNPGAPKTPFEMPEYRNANMERGKALDRSAVRKSSKATEDIQNGDNYILLTVLFASVLFFAGISTKFKTLKIKYALLILGGVLFLGSLIILVFQPIA